MFEQVTQGLIMLMSPYHLLMLGVGVVIGLLVGIIPGIGGLFALAIMLPFIMHFEPTAAIALLIGTMAVVATGDSVSSILLGVPGAGGAVATIVDGHPMAEKGEAARALSAAFFASAVGGVIGAVLLATIIPLARPVLMQFLSPEFFMLCVLGISMAALLTGKRPAKGLIAAALGLLLGAIGTAAVIPYHRFTFGQPYLFDGLTLTVVALGFFALPEVVDMMITGSSISKIPKSVKMGRGMLAGMRDVFRNKWLLLRTSLIGAYVGFLPGMGASVGTWVAYGHALSSAKDKSLFGKGDVRGVLAPESCNNACKGGELIPTLMFGIPGSGSMAVFMVGLMMLGLSAGPRMVAQQLPLIYMIVWSLAIANVVGALICLGLIRPLAKVALVPGRMLAPFILMIILIGAYQAGQDWGDLLILLPFGALGWTMKKFEFARPAMFIGFVLGGIAERNLWLTVQGFGWTGWLLRPWVIAFFLVIVVSLVVALRRQSKEKEQAGPPAQLTA